MVERAITVVELTSFQRRAEKILSAQEHKSIIDFLALNPLAGDEIKGTGGVRKVRFAMGPKVNPAVPVSSTIFTMTRFRSMPC
ncbi:hypothetical protein [Niveispirillum sp. BGYR6]|uniref:hypothetical protein n=1 Tax=Niveispirillum sp. BGYR6 TaxID=2971249 RepID=UPI0022B972B7|nr:hypothetical protein [Niveispirillum sp. BGYR6]MDG5497746.1 hypothetical protein [Niveispirillum sp. BGYR6]